jgi:putative aldouronate transport system substrate-binding protein
MNAYTGIEYDPMAKKWIYGPTMDPNYKQLLVYLNEMYKAGVFNPDAISEGVTNEKVNELLAEGNYAFIYWYYGELEGKWGQYGEEPPLLGMKPPSYKGQTSYRITVPYDRGNYWGYMSPKNVKNPEVLASYVDNIVSEETSVTFEWGIEGLTYRTQADGSLEYLDTLDAKGRSDLGVYNFWDPRYIHYEDYYRDWFRSPKKAGYPANAADIKRLKAGEMKPIFGWPRPQMSVEINDEISKIMTPVNTFVAETELKFITGSTPFSEWDAFIAQIKKLGDIDKVLKYYTDGKNFPMGDRRYPNTYNY